MDSQGIRKPTLPIQRASWTGWVPNNDDLNINAHGANAIGFVTNSTGRMIVTSTGNVGIGIMSPTSRLHVDGAIVATGAITGDNIAAKYQDIAEWVPSAETIEPASVVILDPDHPHFVVPSSLTYDTKVAGVVSATPGIVLGEADEGKVKVATMGRVKVRVDARGGPIQVGDLR